MRSCEHILIRPRVLTMTLEDISFADKVILPPLAAPLTGLKDVVPCLKLVSRSIPLKTWPDMTIADLSSSVQLSGMLQLQVIPS